jgi:DHA3 family macrolide efflux protein-like MFS transporter
MNRLAGLQNFLLVWAGQLVSNIGSTLSEFALGIWVLRTTGSTTLFAITFIVTAIPAILISPFAGVLADRWNRRQIMIACDALSAVLMIGLAGLLTVGQLAVWHIYVAAGSTSLLDAVRSPAFSASVPLIATREHLPRANAVVKMGGAAALIVGPLLAGVLVSSISFQGVLLVDASTFVVGAVTLAMATIPHSLPAGAENGANVLQEAVIGWRYIQGRPGFLGLLGVYGFNHFVFAAASVLIAPLLLSFTIPAMVGLQYSISGCGLLLGGLVMTAFGGLTRQINGVLLFTALGGVCLAAHGLGPSFTVIAVAGFILFTMLPVIDASDASLWQSKVPSHLQGRCFAIKQLLLNVAMGVGYSIAGPLSDYVFEPLMATKSSSLLSHSVGRVIGVGRGRGIGMMFIILGTLMSLVAIRAYCVPAVRKIDELEDSLPSAKGIGGPLANDIDRVQLEAAILREAQSELDG